MNSEQSTRPVRIFISYSHKDAKYKEKLWRQLSRTMGGKGELWHDLMIEPGQKWKEEIWTALHQSDMVLFLMSADSIHSDFIWDVELKKTFERHERKEVDFIPIYLRNCNWQEIAPLKEFQAIPRDNKHMISKSLWDSLDTPFAEVSKEIIQRVKQKWQEINNAIIEQNRPKRFAGICEFLKTNQPFFDMAQISIPSPPSSPEDVMYFLGIASYLKQYADLIVLADRNGTNWAEKTCEKIENFIYICEQMQTVWMCSDYVWSIVHDVHEKSLKKTKSLEKHIWDYVGKDWRAIDEYKAKYALPLQFILAEYETKLRNLAEESLSSS